MKKSINVIKSISGILLFLSLSCTSDQVVKDFNIPEILTPKTSEKPRINGAKIFGVRPGSPFLFKIPATGKRPLNYEVDNLPAGLTCNPENGQITGTIGKAGEYLTTFRVKNELGSAEREFKIVCGDKLALTPHMGWNSWYVWENHITDSIMRAVCRCHGKFRHD